MFKTTKVPVEAELLALAKECADIHFWNFSESYENITQSGRYLVVSKLIYEDENNSERYICYIYYYRDDKLIKGQWLHGGNYSGMRKFLMKKIVEDEESQDYVND